MKFYQTFDKYLESKEMFFAQVQSDLEKPKIFYKPTNLVQEICVSMILLNNQFLDNLLDRGLKARYSENSQVFLTDLKNLLLARNRLKLGKFQDNRFIEDTETSKIGGFFESIDFSIEQNWNDLIDSRIIARNIIDKLLVNEKLGEHLIRNIFWVGPNKSKEVAEDLVIETNDGKQFSLILNKNLSLSKTNSFNTLAHDIMGDNWSNLFSEQYMPKWDKLVQNWIRILYENAKKNIQIHIEKFIDPQRIESLTWFEFFDLKHRDPKFKMLGEYIKEFDKNILWLSDLLNEIWKSREYCFMDPELIYNEWNEKKVFLLNSKILEHIFTESLTKNNAGEIKKLKDDWKLGWGKIKMKFMKAIVEKMGCLERPVYYLGNKGNNFNFIPSRSFFREFYDDFRVKFDYHVKFAVSENEDNNNFKIKVRLKLDTQTLIKCDIAVKFSGGELNSKLSANFKFEPAPNFNLLVSNKMMGSVSKE
jgi:hypothetical protein